MATWTQELAARLAPTNQVTVYCRKAAGRQPPNEKLEDIAVQRVSTAHDEKTIGRVQCVDRILNKLHRLSLIGSRPSGKHHFWKSYYYRERYYRAYIHDVASQIRRQGADWIVLSNFSQFIPVLRRVNPTAKMLLNIQCDWLIELPIEQLRPRLAQVDAICGCSHYIVDGIIRRFPEFASRCFPLHNASDSTQFSTATTETDAVESLRRKLKLEGKKVVLFTGRVCPEKGVHVLLNAMANVLRDFSDVALVIAGSLSGQPPSPKWVFARDPAFRSFEVLRTDYREHLNELTAPISEHVHFVGDIPHADLPIYYQLGDIFVHPAVWQEPFGMTLTEAMSCNLPVISTRVGGIPEIVNPETGLLVRPENADELATAIRHLLGNERLSCEMGQKAALRVREDFSWDKTAARFSQILKGSRVSIDELVATI